MFNPGIQSGTGRKNSNDETAQPAPMPPRAGPVMKWRPPAVPLIPNRPAADPAAVPAEAKADEEKADEAKLDDDGDSLISQPPQGKLAHLNRDCVVTIRDFQDAPEMVRLACTNRHHLAIHQKNREQFQWALERYTPMIDRDSLAKYFATSDKSETRSALLRYAVAEDLTDDKALVLEVLADPRTDELTACVALTHRALDAKDLVELVDQGGVAVRSALAVRQNPNFDEDVKEALKRQKAYASPFGANRKEAWDNLVASMLNDDTNISPGTLYSALMDDLSRDTVRRISGRCKSEDSWIPVTEKLCQNYGDVIEPDEAGVFVDRLWRYFARPSLPANLFARLADRTDLAPDVLMQISRFTSIDEETRQKLIDNHNLPEIARTQLQAGR